MRTDWIRASAAILVILVQIRIAPAGAATGGTITDGTASYVRTASSFDSTPEANLSGVSPQGAADHLFEDGWAFRVAGDSQETFFTNPSTESYVGDHSDIDYADVAGRGLFQAHEHSLVAAASGGGSILHDMQITNLSAVNPLVLELFHMMDVDLQPAFNNDLAILEQWTPQSIIRIFDVGTNFAAVFADTRPSAFLVRANGPTDVGVVLADASVTDFDNTGLPFSAGDGTYGFQFSLTIPPSGTVTVTTGLAVDFYLLCADILGRFCDGFEIGTTQLWNPVVP